MRPRSEEAAQDPAARGGLEPGREGVFVRLLEEALEGSALRVDGRCVVTRKGDAAQAFRLGVGDCADSRWTFKSSADERDA